MAKLTDEQKSYLVTRFACFASPSEVIEELKIRWSLNATVEQVVYYNASLLSATNLAEKWKTLFHEIRASYIAGEAEIACFHRRWRLERLQRMLDDPATQKNRVLLQSLLKQAAEESGNAYTNKREHSGPGGAPIAVRQVIQHDIDELLKLEPAELAGRYREQAGS